MGRSCLWSKAETSGKGIGGSTIRIDHGIADAASPDYYGQRSSCTHDENADTRAGRVELCHKHYQEMLKLKPFCNEEQLNIIRNAEDALKGVKLVAEMDSPSVFEEALFTDIVSEIKVLSRDEIVFCLKCGLRLKERLVRK